MTQVLIIGANGQLGSDLCRIFTQDKVDYLALSRSELDVTKDDVTDVLDKYAADIIINCIATTNVDGCEDSPEVSFTVNAAFVFKLAKFCNSRRITLFHFSTDYVFEGTKQTPYLEDDYTNPLNIYGLSKYAGEVAIRNYHDKFFIFRVSSLFGIATASGKGGNFITTMQRLGMERESISVISNQYTCPTATLDIARCVSHFIRSNICDYGIYNCVSNNSCSWFEFAQKIFILSGLDITKLKHAEFSTYKFKARRPKYAILDNSKLKKYYIMPNWETSLNEYFEQIKLMPITLG